MGAALVPARPASRPVQERPELDPKIILAPGVANPQRTRQLPTRPVGHAPWAHIEPLDLTRIVVVGEIVAAAVAVSRQFARRAPGPRAIVRMGPGGWVSMKGGGVRLHGRRRRPPREQRRPWWALLLRAHRVS
ncbi:hypothetical protein FF36_03184 [Frankia torreyi]|uniref:Uncharacterized protein n=1 Tax=Frankia torreyi TaxID=1856 RepID=A0A0D8BGD3_9ACTN|nr:MULTISPECIES: hypothetical protein [Frankia]KJE22492.1 hypothetical protein FF36_03184 [Frankia torreyi]KQM04530.1 hypothetical protein FF86_102545 [Frankia sp. CpI1-P]